MVIAKKGTFVPRMVRPFWKSEVGDSYAPRIAEMSDELSWEYSGEEDHRLPSLPIMAASTIF